MNSNRYRTQSRARRRGISTLMFALSLPVIIGTTGLVVDLSYLSTRRAIAQRAADAAALAGALEAKPDITLAVGYNAVDIKNAAVDYAKRNGYNENEVDVDTAADGQLGKVRVNVGRNERVFFIQALDTLLGRSGIQTRKVSASATAEKVIKSKLEFSSNYGMTSGASNPSAFGPYSKHSYGDPYSVLYHNNGDLNDAAHISSNKGFGFDQSSKYDPNGFVYTMSVSQNYLNTNGNTVRVQLYDPDGHDSKDGNSLDEIHNDYAGPKKPAKPEAVTEYTLYKVVNGNEVVIKKVTYGDDESVDAAYLKKQGKDQWVTPDGFKFNPNDYGGPGEYKVRVKTVDGSSENGYSLRAGPDYNGTLTDAKWNEAYGDKNGTDFANVKIPIKSDDKIQMNFTKTAHVKVRLSYIPPEAAGQEILVTKFDTDVGSSAIKYSYVEDGTGASKPVNNNDYLTKTDDTWSQDKIEVPKDFKGGYWYAEYDAGQNDTSSWNISYPGLGEGTVSLVR